MGLITRSIQILYEKGVIEFLRQLHLFINDRYKWYRIYTRLKVSHHYMKYRYPHSAPNHHAILFVDPKNINFLSSPPFYKSFETHGTRIRNGDWDLPVTNEEINKHTELNVDERRSIPIRNWTTYKKIIGYLSGEIDKNNLEKYFNQCQYSNPASYIDHIDTMYEYIQNNGYLSQKELKNIKDAPGSVDHNPQVGHGEIEINIGRNGDLIFEDGKIRFAIARYLELTNIPVRICVRHTKWQNKREDIINNMSCFSSYRDHPDIKNLIGAHSSSSL